MIRVTFTPLKCQDKTLAWSHDHCIGTVTGPWQEQIKGVWATPLLLVPLPNTKNEQDFLTCIAKELLLNLSDLHFILLHHESQHHPGTLFHYLHVVKLTWKHNIFVSHQGVVFVSWTSCSQGLLKSMKLFVSICCCSLEWVKSISGPWWVIFYKMYSLSVYQWCPVCSPCTKKLSCGLAFHTFLGQI